MIFDSVLSAKVALASMVSAPSVFSEPANTFAPGCFSTGTDSPVTAASLTPERPAMTTPSVTMPSPGRTRNRSPTFSWLAGTVRSTPSSSSRASFGARSSSDRMEARVRA